MIHRLPHWTIPLCIAAALAASGVPVAAEEPPLTSEQLEFIDLAAYVVTARERCGFAIDGHALGILAGRLRLDFNKPLEREARNAAFERAGVKLSGLRGSAQCDEAMAWYGPEGQAVRGLIRERP